MLTNLKITLSVALVLGTASAALAAPKHAVLHHKMRMTQQQVPPRSYLSLGGTRSTVLRVRSTGQIADPSNFKIEDIGFRQDLGN
jgi:hypothetical protein